jgi:hypothetical protein
MKLRSALSVLVSTLVAACGAAPKVAPESAANVATATVATTETPLATPAAPKVEVARRQVGDFAIFRFAGSFRRAPLVLEERVIGREGTSIAIEMTLIESPGKAARRETLRFKLDERTGGRGEIFDVERIVAGKAIPATVAEYEAFVGRTLLSADANEETLSTEDVDVEVAGRVVPARRTSYRVRIGDKAATMRVLQPVEDAFGQPVWPWGDLGGEIVSENGALLYRAELVEAGDGGGVVAHASDLE